MSSVFAEAHSLGSQAIVHDANAMKRGFDVLRDKTLNQSITFRRKERDRLGLSGLLPYSWSTSS